MDEHMKAKKQRRLMFLITVILLGLAVFAVAYPMAMSGGAVAGY